MRELRRATILPLIQCQMSSVSSSCKQHSANPLISFLPLLVIVAIFYFLVFMPMQKQKKQQAQMLAQSADGNEVSDHGRHRRNHRQHHADDDTLVMRVKPDNIKLQVARSAVAGLVTEK